MSRVTVEVFANVLPSGIIYTVDDQVLFGIGSVPLTSLTNYARGSIIRGGAADWEAYDAKTAGSVLIGDGVDLVSTVNPTLTGTLTLPNAGLHLLDTNASHDLIIRPGSDLSVDRTLTLTTGDAARTITLSGNPTLADWFDQSVKVAAGPTFASVILPDAGYIGNSGATARMGFDSSGETDYAYVIGANLGVGTATPTTLVDLKVDNFRFIEFDRTANANVDTLFYAGVSYTGVGIDFLWLGLNTSTFVITDAACIGVGTNIPHNPTEILKADVSNQLRLARDVVDYVELGVDANGNLRIVPAGGKMGLNCNATYYLDFLAPAGANRNVLRAGMTGVSNGFTVDYIHATTSLRYVFVDGNVGIEVGVPLAKCHVVQPSATGAIPVMLWNQADLSEEFLELTTTVGAGNPIDAAAIGAYYGKMRVKVTGVAGYKYIALYN